MDVKERIFILDSEEGIRLAEEFKGELENEGLRVETTTYATNGVRIRGY